MTSEVDVAIGGIRAFRLVKERERVVRRHDLNDAVLLCKRELLKALREGPKSPRLGMQKSVGILESSSNAKS